MLDYVLLVHGMLDSVLFCVSYVVKSASNSKLYISQKRCAIEPNAWYLCISMYEEVVWQLMSNFNQTKYDFQIYEEYA